MEDQPPAGEFVTVRSSEEGAEWVAESDGSLVAAVTLAEAIAEHGSLTDGETIAVAGGVAAALAAVHETGTVHGALEPGFVTVSAGEGAVQVGGFGAGGSAEAGASPYLAPEQVAGEEPDGRTDLYALGCMMMTMLTGEPPMSAAADPGTNAEVPRTGAPWPSDAKPDVDPALNGLVHDLLAASPGRRPVSAAEVVSRLGRIRADLMDRQVVVALPGAAAGAAAAAAEAAVGGAAVAGAALADGDLTDESDTTQPIAVVGAEEDEEERGGLAGVLGVAAIPWTWVMGSLAGVALVLVLLFLSFGGDETDAPVSAPGTSAPTPPGTSAPGGSESSGTSAASSTTTSATPTTTTTRPTTSSPTSPSSSSDEPATTSAAPPADSPAPRTLDEAISSLRATVRSVVGSGEVDGSAGTQLIQAADELTRWADRSSVQLSRRVSDLDGYVDRLASSGDITTDGYEQVSGAISALQGQLG